ncbi:MAG TPA: hypothetical protein VHW72_14770 [Candidatus Angelobacter sp.]|nr:hypothetical protein [Candidatus Angelobacter sp.]
MIAVIARDRKTKDGSLVAPENGFGRFFVSALVGSGESGCVVIFACCQEAKQVAVGNGAKGFRAVAVVAEAAGGEDCRTQLTVLGFKTFERGEGDAVSTVEVVESFKEFGFALLVGVKLRGRFGAYSFMSSHGCLL